MDSQKSPLFEVYLRLRPPPSLYPQLPGTAPAATSNAADRFLTVEPPSPIALTTSEGRELNIDPMQLQSHPKHITILPPSDSRKRAVEKFAFTRVFEEATTQFEMFDGVGVPGIVEGVLNSGRDGLIATLGVTGSGKVRWCFRYDDRKIGLATNTFINRVIQFLDLKHSEALHSYH
jgi:hypothetical protein